MAEQFHYPPDVLELLVETIPRLCRSKKAVLLFLQGAGLPPEDLADVTHAVNVNPNSISKFEIVRTVLAKLNARGDSGLRPRRELIKRITEFENFDLCWDNDRLQARGLVASVREAVNAKDSFTRMKQEREAEREKALTQRRLDQVTAAERRAKIEVVGRRLTALFGLDERPQERGKMLESVLNDLFKAYGILIREDFRRKAPEGSTVLEQVDGVVELSGAIYLVEMKWTKDPVGVSEFGPHLVRVFGRANVSGIFISNSGFTAPVVTQCADFLNQRTTFLCSLKEIVLLLQRQDDLVDLLKRKSQAAIIDKNPYLEILA